MGNIDNKQLLKKLADFRKKVGKIGKNKQGYGYKYADLENILSHINPVLDDLNLLINQKIVQDNNIEYLQTTIFDLESEGFLTQKIKLPKVEKAGNEAQQLGASITYTRRYSIELMFGLATSEDVDGNIKQNQKGLEDTFMVAKKWIVKNENDFENLRVYCRKNHKNWSKEQDEIIQEKVGKLAEIYKKKDGKNE